MTTVCLQRRSVLSSVTIERLTEILEEYVRGIDLDLQDAAYVMRRFGLSTQSVEEAAASAIAASPKDTTLFLFRTIVQAFCGRR